MIIAAGVCCCLCIILAVVLLMKRRGSDDGDVSAHEPALSYFEDEDDEMESATNADVKSEIIYDSGNGFFFFIFYFRIFDIVYKTKFLNLHLSYQSLALLHTYLSGHHLGEEIYKMILFYFIFYFLKIQQHHKPKIGADA